MSEVTVQQLDEHLAKMVDLETRIDTQKDALTELNKEYSRMEGVAVQFLTDLNRESYDSPHGKVSKKVKWRVNLPENIVEKMKLFAHLEERGIFKQLATINSNSLNSLYMKDWEEAKERGEGMEFTMPGVPAPKPFETLVLKINKKKADE